MVDTSSQKENLFSLIKLLHRGFKNYKRNIVILTMLGFVGSFFESIGITTIIPLFSFITGGGGKTIDIISQFVAKSFAFFGATYSFRYLLLLVVLLFIFRAIVVIVNNYIQIKIGTDYKEMTRNNLFNKMIQADWSYLLKQRLGHLETILVLNAPYGQKLLNIIADALTTSASLIVYVAVAMMISFSASVSTLLLSTVLFVLFRQFIYKTRMLSREAEKMNRDMAHHINENIFGMKTVKAMMVGEKVIDHSREYFKDLKKLEIQISLLRIIPGSLMQLVGLLFVVFLFVISYKTPGFSVGALAAVVYLIQRIFQYVQRLQIDINFINEAIPYLRETILCEEESQKYKESREGNDSFVFRKNLEFKDVSFSYNKKTPVLKQINFSVLQGEMVGLIGPSGGGKTTIVDLILRLFKPEGGTIVLDGKNAETIDLIKWRKKIGYVSQDIFLKNSSIADNIRFYNDSLSDDEIVEAAKMANIYDFVEKLPKKFETTIGERGIMLSAGQRQRIVIARVLAQKPELLVLDEATSALDNESEAEIQIVIEKLKGRLTVIAIAHRLSTIINSDKILILENGQISEHHEPRELLKDENSYLFKVYNIRK
ncbi:MAG: ABC transporter ATP-binding protein [bacterium]|nr:ABC transporter ATP-binding protein [bacterium]